MFVLDNSVYIAGLFDDEKHPLSLTLIHLLVAGEEEAIVPPIFRYEACNAVLASFRRKRISTAAKKDYLDAIAALPIHIDPMADVTPVFRLASKHDLSMYDASYLELALREDVPLATFDKALIRAATKENAPVVE